MAAVRDYLSKLLYQYDCVVVPELGAFLTHYQAASFTEESGLYLPPRKRVAFNEALRFDDGILANYVMLHEPVSREGAQRQIGLFVQEVRQQIRLNGTFELEGIGTFRQNDEGRLQFTPSLRHNFFGEAYGMSALTAQLASQQPVTTPSLEAVPVSTSLGPVLVQDADTTFEPYQPARSYWRVAATALLVGSLGLISYFSVIKPGNPLQSSLDPANLLRLPASAASTVSKKAPILAPVTKAAVRPVPVAATAPAVPTVPTPVPTPVSTAPVSQPVAAVAPVPAATHSVHSGPYFAVIAGSFSSKANALRLRRQLQKAGYADAYIIPPATRKQLYKVVATGSAQREDALASVPAISELAKTSAWIYKN